MYICGMKIAVILLVSTFNLCLLCFGALRKEEKMEKQVIEKKIGPKENTSTEFDCTRLVSNEDFCKNLNAILAYYQMSKGEAKKRFISR